MPIATESEALAALDELEAGTIAPEIAEARKAELKAYRDSAEAKGLPVFPSIEAEARKQREQVNTIFRAGLGKPEALPEPTRAWLDERKALGLDPEAELAAASVQAWMATQTGQAPDAILERYDELKGRLAADWNLPDAEDRTVFQHIQGLVTKADQKRDTLELAHQHAIAAAANGKAWGVGFAEWADPDMLQDPELEGMAAAAYREAHKQIAGDPVTLKHATAIAQALKGGAGAMELGEPAQEAMRWIAAQEPEKIDKTIAVALMMETPENRRTMAGNAAETIARFVATAAGGKSSLTARNIVAANLAALESGEPVYRRDLMKAARRRSTDEMIIPAVALGSAMQNDGFYTNVPSEGREQLTKEERQRAIAESKQLVKLDDLAVRLRGLRDMQDPIKELSTSQTGVAFEKMLYGTAQIVPFAAAAATGPAGLMTTIQGYRYDEARQKGIPHEEAAFISTAQAPVEAALEMVGFKMALGRFPGVGKWLANATGLPGRATRAGVAFTGELAGQIGVELVQDASAYAFQDFAASLSEDVPDVDWRKVSADMAEQFPDMVFTFGPMALMGAGFSTWQVQGINAERERRSALVAYGLDPAEVDRLMKIADPTERATATGTAIMDAQADREAPGVREAVQIDGEWIDATGPDAANFSAEDEAAARSAPMFEKRGDKWAVKFPDQEDAATFPTFRDANLAAKQWELAQDGREADAAAALIAADQDASTEEAIAFFEQEGVRRDGERFQRAAPRSLEDLIVAGQLDEKVALARIRDMMLEQLYTEQNGKWFDPEDGKEVAMPKPSQIYIMGSNEAGFRRNVWRDVSTIADPGNGATWATVAEERAEGAIKEALATSFLQPAELVAEIRKYEQATGDSLLSGDDAQLVADLEQTAIDGNWQRSQTVIEAFSSIATAEMARAAADGRGEHLGSKLRALINQLLAYMAHVARRVAMLRKFAAENGGWSPEMQQTIDRAIGVDDQAIADRIIDEDRRRILEESMDPRSEIMQVLAGRLPLPEDAPIQDRGEIKAIYDSFLKITRRKDRMGRRMAALGKEGRDFFATKGSDVDLDKLRMDVNEEWGFDFQTVAEMLDAVDESMRGRPQFPTGQVADFAEGYGQTFSVSMPATTQKSATVASSALASPAEMPAPRPDSDKLSLNFNEAAGDGGSMTFSTARARENYEKAKNRVLYAKKELFEVEQSTLDAKNRWELIHGTSKTAPPDHKIWMARNLSGESIVRQQGRVIREDGTAYYGYSESEAGFIERAQNLGFTTFFSDGRVLNNKDQVSANRIVRGGAVVVSSEIYDFAPFPEPQDLIDAREYLIKAEADLYLALEEFDPDADARAAAGESARQWKLDQQAAAFAALLDARDQEAANAAASFVARVWNAYGQHDEIFQYARTASKRAEDIAAAISTPDKLVTATDDGSTVRFMGQEGYLDIREADTARPFIRADQAKSKGKASGGGSQLYAAALDWIHNNGKRIKDDVGITAINTIRRTSNFAASAIRHGTTRHLKPHADQKVGKWTKSDILNTSLLLRREMENAFKAIPEAKGWTFNFESGRFEADEKELTAAEIRAAVKRGDPDNSGIGFSTLQRAVITSSAIQAFQQGSAESVVESAESTLPGGLTGITYALSMPDRHLLKLQAAVNRAMGEPERKSAALTKLRDRLDAAAAAHRDRRAKSALTGQTEREDDLRRAFAELEAIRLSVIDIDPKSASKLGNPLKLLDYKSDRGRTNFLEDAIQKAGEAIEQALRRSLRKDLDAILDKSDPTKTEARNIKGRIGAEGHDYFARVSEAMEMDTDEMEATIAALNEKVGQSTDLEEQQAILADIQLLETFGALDDVMQPPTAARLQIAHDAAKATYEAGRMVWKDVLDNRAMVAQMKAQRLIDSLGVTGKQFQGDLQAARGLEDAGAIKGLAEALDDVITGELTALWQVLDRVAEVANDPAPWKELADELRQNDNRQGDRDRATNKEIEDAMARIFGTRSAIKQAAARAKLYDRKHAVTLRPIENRAIKVPLEKIEAIIAGREKLFDEAESKRTGEQVEVTLTDTDRAALTEAYEAFLDLEAKRKAAKKRPSAKRFLTVKVPKPVAITPQAAALKVSEMEAINFILQHRQEDLRDALASHGHSAATIAEMDRALSPQGRALMEWLGSRGDANFEQYDAMHRAIHGVGLPKVKNHFRASFEHDFSKTDPMETDSATSQRSLSAGSIKHRVRHNSRPRVVGALAAYIGAQREMDWWMANVKSWTVLSSVVNNRELQDALRVKLGDRLAKGVINRLQSAPLNGVAVREQTLIFERALGIFRTGVIYAKLGLRIATLMVQATAALGSLTSNRMTGTAYLRGILALIANPSRYAEMWKSPTIRRRIELGGSTVTRIAIESNLVRPSVAATLAQKGIAPINDVDAIFTSISAAAAYDHGLRQAIKAGLPEAEAKAAALEFMDAVIYETAQPATAGQRSAIENKALSGKFAALFVMFASEGRMRVAQSILAARKIVTGRGTQSRMSAGKAFAAVALMNAMAFGIRQVWKELSTREEDDDDKWQDPKMWAYQTLFGSANGIPIVGDAAAAVPLLITGEKAYATQSPIMGSLTEVYRSVNQFIESWKEDDLDGMFDEVLNLAQGLGPVSSPTAVAAQLANLTESVKGLGSSALDDGPSATMEDILADEAKTEREESKARTEDRQKRIKEARAMTPQARAAYLSTLDAETRKTVQAALKKPELPKELAKLDALSPPARARAIARIIDSGEREEAAFMDELRTLKILDADTRKELAKIRPAKEK